MNSHGDKYHGLRNDGDFFWRRSRYFQHLIIAANNSAGLKSWNSTKIKVHCYTNISV